MKKKIFIYNKWFAFVLFPFFIIFFCEFIGVNNSASVSVSKCNSFPEFDKDLCFACLFTDCFDLVIINSSCSFSVWYSSYVGITIFFIVFMRLFILSCGGIGVSYSVGNSVFIFLCFDFSLFINVWFFLSTSYCWWFILFCWLLNVGNGINPFCFCIVWWSGYW